MDARRTLLKKAADLIGRDELATRLNVPPHLLEAWINGQATMPDRKLAMLADVLDRLPSA